MATLDKSHTVDKAEQIKARLEALLAVNKKYTELQAEHVDLQDKYDYLRARYTRLQIHYNSLQTKHDELTETNNKLVAIIDDISSMVDDEPKLSCYDQCVKLWKELSEDVRLDIYEEVKKKPHDVVRMDPKPGAFYKTHAKLSDVEAGIFWCQLISGMSSVAVTKK